MSGTRTVLLATLVAVHACQPAAAPSTPAMGRATRSAPALWFEDLADAHAREPLTLTLDEADALFLRVRARLADSADARALPARLAADTAPRALFLSVAADGSRPADVVLGVGRGVVPALDAAVARLQALGQDAPRPRWLALDLVTRVAGRVELGENARVALGFGMDGLALDRPTGLAFAPRELVGRRLISRAGEPRWLRVLALAERRGLDQVRALFERRAPVGVRPFATQQFFHESAAERTSELFRGHVRERAVSDARLRQAVILAADYLARAVDRRGRFAYAYLAKQGRIEDDYNMVRHAGTIFAMLDAWRVTRDQRLGAAIERAIGYLLAHVEPQGSDASMAALAYGGKIKLGGVALSAIALANHAEIVGAPDHLATARRLCRYLVAQERADGSFLHQRSHPDGAPLSFISEYYPGEAILALMTVYRLDRDPTWLDAAQRAARYLITVRDRGVATRDLTHDHWLLYGLDALHRETADPLFRDHAMRIAQAIMAAQIEPGRGVAPDQVGGYGWPVRSTPIATRNEGLLAAHALALRVGDAAMAQRILGAVERGNEVLLSMQIDGARALHLEEPTRALGGVTRGHEHFGVRIDYVQHSISAWLALERARRSGKEAHQE